MKRVVTVLLYVFCLLAFVACGQETDDQENVYKIYYVSNSETKIDFYQHEMVAVSAKEQLTELLDCLAVIPDKLEYKAPLAMGFQLLGVEVKEGTVFLNVDAAYKNLPATTEVLVRAAIVNTLTQLENVRYVAMTVEGEQLYDNAGELVGWMNAEQFIYNENNEINTYELTRVKLYFPNESGDKLIAAYREKHYSTNISLERFVVEELIAGPSGQVKGLYPSINPSTKILGVMTKDGICYVNLDANFLTVVNNVPTELAVYSIVNSLVELSNVNKVQILIDGEVPKTFKTAIFERNLDCVTTLEE